MLKGLSHSKHTPLHLSTPEFMDSPKFVYQTIFILMNGLIKLPDQVMDDDVRRPEVVNHVRSHIYLPVFPISRLIKHHSTTNPRVILQTYSLPAVLAILVCMQAGLSVAVLNKII